MKVYMPIGFQANSIGLFAVRVQQTPQKRETLAPIKHAYRELVTDLVDKAFRRALKCDLRVFDPFMEDIDVSCC